MLKGFVGSKWSKLYNIQRCGNRFLTREISKTFLAGSVSLPIKENFVLPSRDLHRFIRCLSYTSVNDNLHHCFVILRSRLNPSRRQVSFLKLTFFLPIFVPVHSASCRFEHVFSRENEFLVTKHLNHPADD